MGCLLGIKYFFDTETHVETKVGVLLSYENFCGACTIFIIAQMYLEQTCL